MRKLPIAIVIALSSATSAGPAKPTATFDPPTITGAFDAKVVASTLKRSESTLLACYKKALAKTPDLEGAVEVKFTIGETGNVSGAGATGLDSEDVEKCVQKEIAKLAFAKPKSGAVDVSVFLVFSSGAAQKQVGLLGVLTATDDSSASSDMNVYGDLQREQIGSGGGGTGWGTIGTGRYGTISHRTSGYGTGTGGGHGPWTPPLVSIGEPTIGGPGELDKAVIRRFIKRYTQKLQYCYEKELLAKPSLAGTVTADFTITPNGTVNPSKASGVDPYVAMCISDAIKAIEFPKPKKDGEVTVKYPFTFQPTSNDVKPPPATGPSVPAKPVEPAQPTKK
jgi:hypothetical protein